MTTDLDRDRPTPARTGEPGTRRRKPEGAGSASGAGAGGAAGETARRPGAAGPTRSGAGASTAARPVSTERARGTARLPWALAVLGLLGTLAFAVAWHGAADGSSGGRSDSTQTAAVRESAEAFSVALTNFDGATIDRDFDRVVALSGGEFRAQADDFFSSKVRKQLKEAQASSRGEVRSAYVQSVDGERGSVFVVLDQTIANNRSPQPKADTLRMELAVVRRGDAWLVTRVEVLQAPSGGQTIDPIADPAAPAGSTPGN